MPDTPSVPPSRSPRARRRTKIGLVLALPVFAFVAFLVLGNLVIVAGWRLQANAAAAAEFDVPGIDNFRVVDERVWRGAAPEKEAYAELAARGVKTVVDLRAEDDLQVDEARLGRLGLERVRIPLRDGQTPTQAQVERFFDAVRRTDGPVFVHCGAGVGRTGTMVAAYLVATGAADGVAAMRQNLSVGPPSLEQLAFAAGLDHGVGRPPALLVAASRVLDAPRRIWTVLSD